MQKKNPLHVKKKKIVCVGVTDATNADEDIVATLCSEKRRNNPVMSYIYNVKKMSQGMLKFTKSAYTEKQTDFFFYDLPLAFALSYNISASYGEIFCEFLFFFISYFQTFVRKPRYD